MNNIDDKLFSFALDMKNARIPIMGIVARSYKDRVIGFENKIPWHIPDDLKYFKKLTEGKTVLMGRKTFESMGRPLPNRKNLVLTKNKSLYQSIIAKGAYPVFDVSELRPDDIEGDELWIIGGSEIYNYFIKAINEFHEVIVFNNYRGDAYFNIDFLENDFHAASIVEKDDRYLIIWENNYYTIQQWKNIL